MKSIAIAQKIAQIMIDKNMIVRLENKRYALAQGEIENDVPY